MEQPLVNKKCLVEKFPGKGGWTFVDIPDIPQDKKAHFGWVQVRGTIDGYPIKQYKLMPRGNGHLFLPLKADMRKQIQKGENDWVHVILYADNSPVEIPDEILVCLLESPKAHDFFKSLSDGNQKYYIDWIQEAKRLETKVNRIAKMMERLEKREKMFDVNKAD